MGVFYATRETVAIASDQKALAYTSSQIDRSIDAGARLIEGLLNKEIIAPTIATKTWRWPNYQNESWTLWLDATPLLSLTTLVSGGTTIPASGYYLEPDQYGPPYNRIEINQGSSYAFAGGASGPQRSISVTGLFGEMNDERSGGTLIAAITSSQTTMVSSRGIGVGAVLRIDNERVLVTDRGYVASGQTGTLTNLQNAQTLAVADGTQFTVGEVLLIDAERVRVVDIAGNNLIVKRAWDGTTLAAHTAASIFWPRTLTITRGALGTAAASHLISAPVYRWSVPPAIEALNVAYALVQLQNESSTYAPRVGSGSTDTAASHAQLIGQLEQNVIALHGRVARQRAV